MHTNFSQKTERKRSLEDLGIDRGIIFNFIG
jgi:hypothetical protein